MADTQATPNLRAATDESSSNANRSGAVELSIVIPMFNEEDNVGPLLEGLLAVSPQWERSFEVIAIDDGSTDRTFERVASAAELDPRIKVIRLRRNSGQTAAMAAGFDFANGDVIVPMDGDLQNDPADIRRLLDILDEGYDVVSGWRVARSERSLSRTLPSRNAGEDPFEP